MRIFFSKVFSVPRLACFFLFLLFSLSLTQDLIAESLKVKISVPASAGEIRVELQLPEAVQSWSFRNSYAGALGLGNRIQDFRASGTLVRNVTSGEFRADQRAKSVSYSVNLNPANHPADLAHISWLAGDYGFLMLSDLLPQFLGEHEL